MLKTAHFYLKKLSLRHFCRECRENLNIRVLRTKIWVKSACEEARKLCQPGGDNDNDDDDDINDISGDDGELTAVVLWETEEEKE